MALICGDGFDHYPTAMLLNKWDVAGGTNTIHADYGRLGSQGIRVVAGVSILGVGGPGKNLPAANAGVGFVGQAVYAVAVSGRCERHV